MRASNRLAIDIDAVSPSNNSVFSNKAILRESAVLLRILPLTAAVFVAGCAIRPLPENVSGVTTPTIVKQIRCETRQAIIDLTLGWLTADENLRNRRVDPQAHAIGWEFKNRRRPIAQFEPKLFHGHVRDVVDTFYTAGVAYTFDLEMTEANNLRAELNLLKPFTDSNLKFGLKGQADRSRKNQRLFTLTDNFGGLLKLPEHYCSGESIGRDYSHLVPPDYIYPITGNIGVKGFLADFINMSIFDNLGGPKDEPKGPPTLVDALEFQTMVSGGVTPSILFTQVTPGLQVVDASFTGEAIRTDLHKITMGVAVTKPGLRSLGQLRAYPAFPSLLLISARPKTSAEAIAADAVNQALTLNLFRTNIVVAR
ncbi:hypothetical protein EOW77_0034340 [Bradyrhizobium yuanmingense]|uniref:hypothetical protein n=1 Tax=Bradyrhizobium yuanmingense TaxID=108015 RepID=UPI000FE4062A|nr:hypothetical protein [Bradyrhizobium yuanmingense]TGN74178.1 hypothetical protein EOW77_0034340 [Bradyrhizobium yuanmingense]